MTPEEQEYVEAMYTDPEHPASYSGLDKLYRVIKEDGRFRITRKKRIRYTDRRAGDILAGELS